MIIKFFYHNNINIKHVICYYDFSSNGFKFSGATYERDLVFALCASVDLIKAEIHGSDHNADTWTIYFIMCSFTYKSCFESKEHIQYHSRIALNSPRRMVPHAAKNMLCHKKTHTYMFLYSRLVIAAILA